MLLLLLLQLLLLVVGCMGREVRRVGGELPPSLLCSRASRHEGRAEAA